METEPTPAHAPPQAVTAVLEHSQGIGKIADALSKAQGAMKPAERDAENPYFSSTYNTLASSWEAARTALAANGLAVVQGPAASSVAPDGHNGERGQVKVTSMLVHNSGEWFRVTVTLPVIAMSKRRGGDTDNDADRAPGRITPQAVGSAITYGRRYGFDCLVGVAPEAEDDDGNAGSGHESHEAIPSAGVFEDVIQEVTFREVKKKGGGSFKIAQIKTGKHGNLECYEREAAPAAEVAGTGEVVSISAEKDKFGWKFKHLLRKSEDAFAGAQAAAPQHPETPFKWVKGRLALCRSEKHFKQLEEECARRGGEYDSQAIHDEIKLHRSEFQKQHQPTAPAAN